jgi:hypothetical protein
LGNFSCDANVNNAPNAFAKKYEPPPVGEEGFSKVLINAMPSVGIATRSLTARYLLCSLLQIVRDSFVAISPLIFFLAR